MDGEAMQKNLDDILDGKGGVDAGGRRDFEITKEEATKFKAAMADPEFQSMLRDYMEEMQDPAQREEQEAYITQLESQNRVPEGKDIVHPLPGFVIKTKFARGPGDGQREKLFVNVVTSDKLAKPYSKASDHRRGGESWSLPVAVGPLRMEKDKTGDSTTTFDVCYHPEALVRARKLNAFRDIVALSSLERVEEAFLRATEQKMAVDQNYRILKGVTYKSGTCAAMMVSKNDINRNQAEEASKVTATPPTAEAKSANSTPANELKSKANKPPAASKTEPEQPAASVGDPKTAETTAAADREAGSKAGDAERKKATGSAPAEALTTLPPGYKSGSGGTTYKLVESGVFEIADHTSDRVKEVLWPKALIAWVKLPAYAEPTRKLDVVITSRRLTIGVIDEPDEDAPRYLNLALPYAVEDESKCSAARDKGGLLKITMPVKPPPPPPPPPQMAMPVPIPTPPEPAAAVARDDAANDGKETLSDVDHGDAEGTAYSNIAATGEIVQDAPRPPDHSRWVNPAEESEKLDKPWEETQKTESGENREVFAAQGKRAIDELPPPPPEPVEAAEEVVSDAAGEVDLERAVAEDAAFVKCPRFLKKMDGYEYKTGVKGCGYYRDDQGKRVPPIEWNETVQTMCGVVGVAHVVDATVRFGFFEQKMTLSFDARGEGAGGSIERYRTELALAGGVSVAKCTHNTAEHNMVVKIAKDPVCEWGRKPIPTSVTSVGAKIDALLDGMASADTSFEALPTVAALPGAGGKEDDVLAPGHGGLVSPGGGGGGGGCSAAADLSSLPFELDS